MRRNETTQGKLFHILFRKNCHFLNSCYRMISQKIYRNSNNFLYHLTLLGTVQVSTWFDWLQFDKIINYSLRETETPKNKLRKNGENEIGQTEFYAFLRQLLL